MERSSTSLHLLVILLGFFHLITFNGATLITGSRRLLQEPEYFLASADTTQTISEEELKEELISGRMELENTDYPGSGANNRHTPKPGGRG